MKDLIVFETDDLIVLNKPAGLLSIPDREGKEISLKKMLQDKYGNIFTVHRLDRGTSGLIIFAKNEETHKHLSKQFEEHQTVKIYSGLVIGSMPDKKGSIDLPVMENPSKKGVMIVHKNGKLSLTDYEVLEDFGIFSWLQFQIHTGRTHQIRVHMQHLAHPIACDELYGDGKPVFISAFKSKFKLAKKQEEERPILDRLALHAHKLKFYALGGNAVELEAPVPKDLKATLQQLRKTMSTKR